jgi:hypothetical protein
MSGEMIKLSAEISASPLLSNSVSGLIGLLGAAVGGLNTALATAAEHREPTRGFRLTARHTTRRIVSR